MKEHVKDILKIKGHFLQNQLKVLWSDLFWKNIMNNTNERSDELLKWKGRIEQYS